MMANELNIAPLKFGVTFKKSSITINNQKELEIAVENYVNKYDGLAISAETLPEAKKTRAEINKLIGGLDDKRKEIKKEYNVPLKSFEAVVKSLTDKLHKAAEPIDEGIKELEQQEKDDRFNQIKQIVEEMAPNYELDPNDFEIDNSITIKTLSNIKRTKLIADKMKLIQSENNRLKSDIQSIERYAKAKKVESDGWKLMVKNGKPLFEVMTQIDYAVNAQKEKELKKAEYDKAIEDLKMETVNDQKIDKETGEIINQERDFLTQYNLTVNCTQNEYQDFINYLVLSEIDFKEE